MKNKNFVRKSKKQGSLDIKWCIYCGDGVNGLNEDGLCTQCHWDDYYDSVDLVLFDRFAHSFVELRQ